MELGMIPVSPPIVPMRGRSWVLNNYSRLTIQGDPTLTLKGRGTSEWFELKVKIPYEAYGQRR